jgi:hypothetical protein
MDKEIRKWGVLVLIGALGLLLFEAQIALTAPFSTYMSYLDSKVEYSCGADCSAYLQACTYEGKRYFRVSGWRISGIKKDKTFDDQGLEICNASWSLSACRSGDCFIERYEKCPETGECQIIAGFGDKSLLNFPK